MKINITTRQTVRLNAESLLTIINDILDFSKIEAGMIELEEVEFNLRKVLDDFLPCRCCTH